MSDRDDDRHCETCRCDVFRPGRGPGWRTEPHREDPVTIPFSLFDMLADAYGISVIETGVAGVMFGETVEPWNETAFRRYRVVSVRATVDGVRVMIRPDNYPDEPDRLVDPSGFIEWEWEDAV